MDDGDFRVLLGETRQAIEGLIERIGETLDDPEAFITPS
jgi:hypothetical protein